MGNSDKINAALEQADALRRGGSHGEARAILLGLLNAEPQHPLVHYRLGQIAANLGDLEGCRTHLQSAHTADPGNIDYALRLGNVCERLRDLQAAIAAYRQVLAGDPRNVPALIRLADLAILLGDKETAVDACQRVVLIQGPVATALRDPRLPAPVRDTLTRIRLTLREKYQQLLSLTREYLAARYAPAELTRIDKALSAIGDTRARGGHAKQKPEFLAFPGLEPTAWFEREQFAWASRAEHSWETIRDEYLALNSAGPDFHPYIVETVGEARTLQGTDFSTLAGNRDWSAFHLNKAGWLEENCAQCPQTAELMKELPLAEAKGYMPEVFFSRLSPGTEIIPHYGQTNVRLTVHLGLIIPPNCGIRVGAETRHWQEGRLLAFDDSFEHAAWNRSDSDRVVLIFEAWHPDLKPAEIDGLQHFFETRSRWLSRFADISPQGGSHS
ncbi:MAG: aspartyl/asparaginyl beta-hydroxylase domain-containing protein [Gammaproteobacteria bacterium]|nr:aspartyl/asparaginyl beta-hydroxylase domain-containing protein [Gammaproteobacteria bacterium]